MTEIEKLIKNFGLACKDIKVKSQEIRDEAWDDDALPLEEIEEELFEDLFDELIKKLKDHGI